MTSISLAWICCIVMIPTFRKGWGRKCVCSSRSLEGLAMDGRGRSVQNSWPPGALTTFTLRENAFSAGSTYRAHGGKFVNVIIYSNTTNSTVNSLWPSHAIWQHRSGSTLAQVMACCLMVSSHYLNQCWLIIDGVLWHSPVSNFASAHELNS